MDIVNKIECNLREYIREENKQGYERDIMEMVLEHVESALIYTATCYEVLNDLMVTDFEEAILEGYKDISGFAFYFYMEYLKVETDFLSDL